MKIYYIRHGDPIYDPDSLTEKGIAQAKATAKYFDAIKLDRIYSSTSNRAYLTAKETAIRQNKEIVQLDFANEKYAWRNLTMPDEINSKTDWVYRIDKYKKLFVNPEVLALGHTWYTHHFFKDCNFKTILTLADNGLTDWLNSLGISKDKKTGQFKLRKEHVDAVALFAHGGFGTVFMSYMSGIPYNISCLTFTELSTCGIIEFEINENDTTFKCQYYNRIAY